jgi:hypothetical protein
MLRISPAVEGLLSLHPEYRMGYHKVIATLNSGGKERGMIVNSTIFLKEGEIPWQMQFGWDYFITEAAKSPLIVANVEVIPREPETLRGVKQIALSNEKFHRLANRKQVAANAAHGLTREQLLAESRQYEFSAKSAGAEQAVVTLTLAGEIFRRFCASSNDRRVTAAHGLIPGTFATTKEDAEANVRTGADAVARYALPNAAPASNVFTITPPIDTDLKRGTTQPANNQAGGGVEVIFVNGSLPGTVTGPEKIPDK